MADCHPRFSMAKRQTVTPRQVRQNMSRAHDGRNGGDLLRGAVGRARGAGGCVCVYIHIYI